ncbi:MAG: 3-oxoacyl-ACP synthase, partial [Verrucomicrobiota bacterium]
MNSLSVCIAGTGSYVPARILTNAELSQLVDTSEEWILSRTGIRERRIAAADETTSQMATHAARRALDNAGMSAEELELIIVATITPDTPTPATACYIQQSLGASRAVAFDISAACSGFLYAMKIAKRLIASGAFKNAIIIGAEKLSSVTNWDDRTTCV